jgi:alkyldihydroxyacetonephosphate synthase
VKTYRDIFKWGDKHEEKIDENMIRVIKEKFGYTDSDFLQKHLSGDSEISDISKSKLKEETKIFLRYLVGIENIKTDDFTRANFSYGKYYSDLLLLRKGIIKSPPDVVVCPRNEDEIEKIIEFCNKNRIPVIPVGGQSTVTRGTETPEGGIVLDLTKYFDKILEINTINQTVKVQAGIYGPAFEEELNKSGFTCGHFPQSFEYSTAGGWIAARGAGQASTGYGKIEDMVLALKVITPAGKIENKSYPKSAQAWDIFPMFFGSEGTLGVITEITMKIRRYRPENTRYASFIFKDFESAVSAMREIMQSGIGLPHLFRISDPTETDIAFKSKGFDNSFNDRILKSLGYKQGKRVIMFVSVEGHWAYTKTVISRIRKKALKFHALSVGKKPTRHWLKQRYSSAYLRDPLMDAGIMTDTMESAVMWENLIPLWKSVHEYVAKRSKTVLMIHISHVYENGANLYFTFLSPMKKGEEIEDYKEFHKGLVETIIRNNGSLSHHHGIGRTLAPWMPEEIGTNNMNVLRAVKKHFDPNGIMNPGGTLGL